MDLRRRVVDPAGRARGTAPRGSGFEGALKVAWGLRDRDGFVMKHDAGGWSLQAARHGAEHLPALQVGPRLHDLGADRRRIRAALLEAAWNELAVEGWSVRLEGIGQVRRA